MMSVDEATRVMTCQPSDLARRVIETHVTFFPNAPADAIRLAGVGVAGSA